VRFDHSAQRIVLQDHIRAIEGAEARLLCPTRQIEELLPNWSMTPVVTALQAMRGVAPVVAVTGVAEGGDFRRLANAWKLMTYLGLVPSEHSSGRSVRRGGITEAGNALARRVLIEEVPGPTACRRGVSRKLYHRNEGLPPVNRDIAWKGPGSVVSALSPARRGRKAEGDRHHRDPSRDGRLHLVHRPHRAANVCCLIDLPNERNKMNRRR
jgi:transposase